MHFVLTVLSPIYFISVASSPENRHTKDDSSVVREHSTNFGESTSSASNTIQSIGDLPLNGQVSSEFIFI